MALACIAPLAVAQPSGQVVRGPAVTYWITADTTSGLGAMTGGGGFDAMLGMLSGRGGGPTRTLDLRLGSTQAASGPPRADHRVPAAMAMGDSLPLLTPAPAAPAPPPREPSERTLPEGMEQPRGRLLVFWGCGERAGPGQPMILDFSRIGAGQPIPQLVSRDLRIPSGPSFGSSRSFGSWPNERDARPVPPHASLRGEHRVSGNYSPDIRFAVDRHDFMPAAELTAAPATGGGRQLTWKPVTGATGYFVTAFGAGGDGSGATDVVMWSSSAVQETGGALGGHVPPGEVARMVRERVVLPPDRTGCTVPVEVIRAMPMGMLNFSAYGDELNLVHPPRPDDAEVPWNIEWAVKLRLRSTAMMPLGEGLAGMPGRGASPAAGTADTAPVADGSAGRSDAGGASAPDPSASPQQPAQGPMGLPTEAVEQGVRVLRGLFGR